MLPYCVPVQKRHRSESESSGNVDLTDYNMKCKLDNFADSLAHGSE